MKKPRLYHLKVTHALYPEQQVIAFVRQPELEALATTALELMEAREQESLRGEARAWRRLRQQVVPVRQRSAAAMARIAQKERGK